MMRTSTLLRLRRADAPDLALLERAQQLRLQVERQLAELVEEQRAAVGLLEQAGARHHRAGEAALLVAEQLALDQVRRHRAAVEHDELVLRERGDSVWIACATTSLPVPVSPSMTTVVAVGAIFSMIE